MKTLKIIASIILLGSFILCSATTIDEQIEAIQNAAPEERVELVNEFKTTLSTMTQEERMEAISKLRESMQAGGDKLQVQTRTRTRVQDGEQSGEMIRSQHMNQSQMGSNAKMGADSAGSNAGGQGGFGKR